LDIDDWRACRAFPRDHRPGDQSDFIPAEDFVNVFGCGRFLAGQAPARFDMDEIERDARDFFG
jgi:hypothetical protein